MSPATSKSPHSPRNVTLPVLNIPTSPLSNRRYKGGGGAGSGDPSPPSTSTGHPGLPNGLLRMANMQQQSSNPAQPPPKIATKIVPKDLKSQLALSKIGLLDGGAGGHRNSLINMSLAQSVANAVKFPPLIPPHVVRATGKKDKGGSNGAPSSSSASTSVVKNKQSNNNQQHQHQQPQGKSGKQPPQASSSKGGSPNSSRSSSRNSSLSPKEKMTSAAASKASKAVKRIKPNQPLVSWAARNGGVPKKCNGWSWVGEGFEQRVDLNVS